jgi:hypothetical protein
LLAALGQTDVPTVLEPVGYVPLQEPSLLAMDVNDNACFLDKRVALEFIASKLGSYGV